MTAEIQEAIKEAENDDEVKVLFFKANGENFCAGFDLSQVYRVYGGSPEVQPYQSTRLRIDEDHIVGFRKAVFSCKKITMAQVQGWCIEAGMYIPECSDIAVAAKNARFAHRVPRRGL